MKTKTQKVTKVQIKDFTLDILPTGEVRFEGETTTIMTGAQALQIGEAIEKVAALKFKLPTIPYTDELNIEDDDGNTIVPTETPTLIVGCQRITLADVRKVIPIVRKQMGRK